MGDRPATELVFEDVHVKDNNRNEFKSRHTKNGLKVRCLNTLIFNVPLYCAS